MNRYLVLEDEPLIAMDLQFAFEDAGALALTTSCCKEAMAIIESEPLAGAVLDVNLGRGETCERAAAELTSRGVPFVLHTGDLDRVGEFLRGLDAPILSKPQAANDVVRYAMALG